MVVKRGSTGSRADVAESGRKLFDDMTASFAAFNVNGAISEDKDVLVVPSFENVDEVSARKPGVIPKMWTPEEDKILRTAVEKYGEKNWREIAEDLDGRNHLQCLQRWKKALRPGLVKGHWSKDEDDYLLKLMKDYEQGKWNWAKISENIPGRNAKQCRERWFLNLDPSINRGPWDEAEDEKLLRLHSEFKGRWSLIAKEMEGRTENSVKTRFHSLQRREVRSRGWLEEEDDVFVRGLLVYGRNYALCARLLPGRSRGQLKKRFPTLLQLRPSLGNQVKMVEARIERGHKPMPIHEMLKKLQEERKLKEQMKERERRFENEQEQQNSGSGYYNYEGTDTMENTQLQQQQQHQRKHGLIKKQPSSWVEDFMQNCTEPYQTPMLPRTSSTAVLTDFLVEEPAQMFNYSIDDNTSEYRHPQQVQEPEMVNINEQPRTKQLNQKQNSLMVLDSILNNMEETGGDVFGLGDGGFNQDQVGMSQAQGLQMQNNYSGSMNENMKAADRSLKHRTSSSGFSKLLFDEEPLKFDENSYQQQPNQQYNNSAKDDTQYNHQMQKRFSSWNKMPTMQSFSSLDLPVV